MTTEPLASAAMRERIARLRAALDAAPAPALEPDPSGDASWRRRAEPGPAARRRVIGRGRVSGPLILAVESSCDETGVALVEDGRRIHANVVASQVALHAPTGGIVPEVAARAHLRWIVPVLDEALATAGVDVADVDAVAVTYGPGLAGSLLVGINFAKTLAWAHGKPLVAGQPPRGPRLRGLAARPGRGGARGAAVPARRARRVGRPHVPRRDARPPRLPAARARPSTTPRARRSTRSGGCWASGTRAARRSRARPRAPTAQDRVFPRAWLGDSYDFSFSGLKTAARRIVDGGARRGGPAAPTSARARLPEPVVAELAWGFQDSVVDVLATKTIRAAEEVGRAGDRAGRRRGRERGAPGSGSPARPRRAASRWSSRGPGCAPTTAR